MLQTLWFEKIQEGSKLALPVLGYPDSLVVKTRERLLSCVFPDSPSVRAIADNKDFVVSKEKPVIRLLEAKLNGSAKGLLGLTGGTASFVIKPQKRSDRPIIFVPRRSAAEGVELIEPDEDFSGPRQVRILSRGVVEGSRDMADKDIKVRLQIWYPNAIDLKLPTEPLPPDSLNLHAIGAPDNNPECPEILSIFGCYTDEAEFCRDPNGIRLKLRYKSILNEAL